MLQVTDVTKPSCLSSQVQSKRKVATSKGVAVRNVDLGVELQILGYHEQMRGQSSSQHNPVSV